VAKKNKNFIRTYYSNSWNYLKESRNFIYAIIIIFLLSSLIGFFIPVPEELAEVILEYVKQLLEKTQNMGGVELTGFIFLNNIQSSFFGMILGIVLGIFSVFSTIANGYLIGFISSLSVSEEGIFSLWRLVPHGIFELPAIFISFGLGLKFGSFIFQKKRLKAFREYLLNSLTVFVFVILPLLIIAAIIEGTLIALLA